MAFQVFMCQRTGRQVVKRLDAGYSVDASFGVFGTIKTDNTGLNFPWSIAADPSDNIYVCDSNNNRIVKLDGSLSYVANVDVSTEIGRPHAIFYDTTNSDLYVVGIKSYLTLSIARITTALSISKYNDNIGVADSNDQPMGISRGFGANDFLISGMLNLLKVTENGSFSSASTQLITGESGTKFVGNVLDTAGSYLYLISRKPEGSWIVKVDNTYTNIGDSQKISKSASTIIESANTDKDLLIFDDANKRILRYDTNLNYQEVIYQDTGNTVITGGVNDKIDFEETGNSELTATLTPGTYTQGNLATEIKTQLDLAGASTYTVTYISASNKMRIDSDGLGGGGVFNLLFSTGTNAATSVARTVGFFDTDHKGELSYSSEGTVEFQNTLNDDCQEVTGLAEIDV